MFLVLTTPLGAAAALNVFSRKDELIPRMSAQVCTKHFLMLLSGLGKREDTHKGEREPHTMEGVGRADAALGRPRDMALHLSLVCGAGFRCQQMSRKCPSTSQPHSVESASENKTHLPRRFPKSSLGRQCH